MNELREWRIKIENLVEKREVCPSKKEVIEKFPKAPHQLIRACVQSRRDRELASPEKQRATGAG